MSTPPAASPHRRALVTWLAVYPTITLTLAVLGPVTAGLPLPVQTFAVTVVAVPAISYVVLPCLLRAQAHLSRRAASAGRCGFGS